MGSVNIDSGYPNRDLRDQRIRSEEAASVHCKGVIPMPTAHVRLKNDATVAPEQESIPDILKTPSGTVMLEIQGVINVGDSPLIRTELDLGPAGPERREEVIIGNIDLTQVTEAGSPVKLIIGDNQLLRGKIVKLGVPLALLEMNASDEASTEIPVIEIITHKVVFSTRPEPLLSQSK